MGSRATIRVALNNDGIESAVHYYTHWEGSRIEGILAQGILKAHNSGRLDDSTYASRIIFDTLTGCDGSDTGFGIIPGDDNLPGDLQYDSPSITWKDWGIPTVSTSSVKEVDALVWALSVLHTVS